MPAILPRGKTGMEMNEWYNLSLSLRFQAILDWFVTVSALLAGKGRQGSTRPDSDEDCIHIGMFPSFSRNNFVEHQVRGLRNGRSLQHPKQISALAIVEGARRTILVLCSYIACNLVLATALCKNFPQMFSCLRRSDRWERDGMGHVCM